jgi:hypothetical protein
MSSLVPPLPVNTSPVPRNDTPPPRLRTLPSDKQIITPWYEAECICARGGRALRGGAEVRRRRGEDTRESRGDGG